ncbi:hypothetical protein [Streptomyces longhuiensis]|uniref:hypothetical protein n=1 Tax=Streptomyces longhuiensis TaxID=2880933 RepID=UPI001D0AEB4B|nr:hypothetical protein [Streptomyces longhuiensis]UDM05538.1 hypothetical protein LGI35_45675 [Streptomyces longhuiensis]
MSPKALGDAIRELRASLDAIHAYIELAHRAVNSEQIQTILERIEAEAQRGSSATHEVWLYAHQSH